MTISLEIDADIEKLAGLSTEGLHSRWRSEFGRSCPTHLSKQLLVRLLAYQIQVRAYGGLSKETQRFLDKLARANTNGKTSKVPVPTPGAGKLTKGTILMREHKGHQHHVTVIENGFIWNGTAYPNLSKVAFAITGTKWNGPRFFGLRQRKKGS